MARTKKAHTLLFFILYGTMFLFGFLENIKGVSYPLIKNEFNVSYETQGKMISALSFCYTFFVVISGFVLGRFGIKKVYILGLVLALLGAFSVYFMPSFWTTASALFLIFAGFGVFEIGINAAAARLFTGKTALMMNLLHFMYGFGSVASPQAAGKLADPAGPGLGWRQIYLISAPLVLLVVIVSFFAKFPQEADSVKDRPAGDPERPSGAVLEPDGKEHGFVTALKTPLVWGFGLSLGLMMGIEMASSNWGGLYFQDVYGMDPATRGANFVSAFFVLFTLSRLASGFVIERAGYMRSLIGAVLIVMAIFAAGFALGPAGIYVLPVLGFFIAIFWPTLLSVAIKRFGNSAPVMTSAIIAIGGLVNAAMQFVMGYVNRWDAAWGYRSSLIFALALLCLLLKLNRDVKKTVG
ncbi:MAG: MFS transporter [Treponema sp.]|jgi:fucose permease|nr:MFS transporter [Treponema sp.]